MLPLGGCSPWSESLLGVILERVASGAGESSSLLGGQDSCLPVYCLSCSLTPLFSPQPGSGLSSPPAHDSTGLLRPQGWGRSRRGVCVVSALHHLQVNVLFSSP